MAQNVKILNWNIQNFGPKKAGFPDILQSIAGVIFFEKPDIFVLLELNTTDPVKAISLAKKLAEALYKLTGYYRVVVLSPNTGREFYAYFVRNPAVTIPLVCRTALGAPVTQVGGAVALTVARFVQPVIPPVGVQIIQNFPLMQADVPQVTSRGRVLNPPAWSATRLPALGMFWCPNASAGNQLLPIVACHFAANKAQAYLQYRIIRWFSLLYGLGTPPVPPPPPPQQPVAPVTLQVQLQGQGAPVGVPTRFYVLTGDFNIDYVPGSSNYAALTNNTSPNLGATALITAKTHLTTYKNFSYRTMKTPEDLVVNCYDNFFVRVDPANAGAATPVTIGQDAPSVYEVPRRVYAKGITFNKSATHYAELDQRGFKNNLYADFGTNFVQQLTSSYNNVNVKGSLVGARMISDHLPVSFTLILN